MTLPIANVDPFKKTHHLLLCTLPSVFAAHRLQTTTAPLPLNCSTFRFVPLSFHNYSRYAKPLTSPCPLIALPTTLIIKSTTTTCSHPPAQPQSALTNPASPATRHEQQQQQQQQSTHPPKFPSATKYNHTNPSIQTSLIITTRFIHRPPRARCSKQLLHKP